MGQLKVGESSYTLGVRQLVGRGELARLRLKGRTVSSEHASLYYEKKSWRVRDLGSRNGTFKNGELLPLRRSVSLTQGDTLQFGSPEELVWTLTDAAPPLPAATGPRGQRIYGEASELWLPHPEEPTMRIYRTPSGWQIDSPLDHRTVEDGEQISVAEQNWLLELPPFDEEEAFEDALSTAEAQSSDELTLQFSVSSDEEHVELVARSGRKTVTLGARAHNYALLVLARKRIEDRQNGIERAERGWAYAQELREQLQVDRSTLNLQLWRARQQLNKDGLPGDCLVERRDDSGQLRLGFDSIIQHHTV